jgi:hypothetical protein
MGDDGGPDFGDLGGLLFGYILYREMRDGRLDGDGILRAGCLLALIVGAVLGGGLLLIGLVASAQPYGSDLSPRRPPAPYATPRPAVVPPVTVPPTERPAPTSDPSAAGPSAAAPATSRPTPLPGIGTRVPAGDGWAVTVTRVERWRPGSYDEPGWRLLVVRLKVRLPAVDDGCVFPSSFWLQARSGRTYEAFEWPVWEPQLFECADYHRPTTAQGWVTFEVRDADARGLVLETCLPELFTCETPLRIRLR